MALDWDVGLTRATEEGAGKIAIELGERVAPSDDVVFTIDDEGALSSLPIYEARLLSLKLRHDCLHVFSRQRQLILLQPLRIYVIHAVINVLLHVFAGLFGFLVGVVENIARFHQSRSTCTVGRCLSLLICARSHLNLILGLSLVARSYVRPRLPYVRIAVRVSSNPQLLPQSFCYPPILACHRPLLRLKVIAAGRVREIDRAAGEERVENSFDSWPFVLHMIFRGASSESLHGDSSDLTIICRGNLVVQCLLGFLNCSSLVI